MKKDRTQYHLTYRHGLKLMALQAYSIDGVIQCACCGCPYHEYLQIDHVKGGGREHKKITGDTQLARWLRNNNYPVGFQVLCSICNGSKNAGDICSYHKFMPKRIWKP